jgi:hypothetical protein
MAPMIDICVEIEDSWEFEWDFVVLGLLDSN